MPLIVFIKQGSPRNELVERLGVWQRVAPALEPAAAWRWWRSLVDLYRSATTPERT